MADAELAPVQPTKAYKNQDFLNSREARVIRIMCEFEDTLKRLREQGVKETIMVFGSARARDSTQYAAAHAKLQARISGADQDKEKEAAQRELARLESGAWMNKLVEDTVELTRRLTEFAMNYESNATVGGGFLTRSSTVGSPAAKRAKRSGASSDGPVPVKQSLMICTGGGPGLMEAANKGASLVPGAKNIGMGISLPFEAGLNPYVTPELAFEYHYFFTRKYWMLYPCRALIVTPGGFGTMDELFELLTLKQTGKIKVDIPVVLFGKSYWQDVINFENLVKYGTIGQKDLDSLFFTDSVDEAYTYVTQKILELRDAQKGSETI